MDVVVPDSWPATVEEAIAVQERLRPLVDQSAPAGLGIDLVAGCDVAYDTGSDRLAAAVAVLDATSLELVDRAVVFGEVSFPYVPGLFAFRELPWLLTALQHLGTEPDLLVCDGHGVAHPRGFGLACHLGILTGLPTIGVAKTPMGWYDAPDLSRGAWSDLTEPTNPTDVSRPPGRGRTVGRALRTQSGVKPVFVSVGHRIDLDLACAQVLRLSPRYRLPETTRRADQLCRRALAGQAGHTPPREGRPPGVDTYRSGPV